MTTAPSSVAATPCEECGEAGFEFCIDCRRAFDRTPDLPKDERLCDGPEPPERCDDPDCTIGHWVKHEGFRTLCLQHRDELMN